VLSGSATSLVIPSDTTPSAGEQITLDIIVLVPVLLEMDKYRLFRMSALLCISQINIGMFDGRVL